MSTAPIRRGNGFLGMLIAALLSGSVISTVLGLVFARQSAHLEASIKNEIDRSIAVFRSTREWKEASVSELLGPIQMQFDRTKRAFQRWEGKNLYLEAKIIRKGNLTIRDLLLSQGHLIPPELRPDAAALIEHYDVWLEEFDRVRSETNPANDTQFVYAGPAGYAFPTEAARHFRQTFRRMWSDLYGDENSEE